MTNESSMELSERKQGMDHQCPAKQKMNCKYVYDRISKLSSTIFTIIKLLSKRNISVLLALLYLTYYFGGAYLVFKGFLALTSFIWYVFNVALRNPLQMAVLVIMMYLLSVVNHFGKCVR